MSTTKRHRPRGLCADRVLATTALALLLAACAGPVTRPTEPPLPATAEPPPPAINLSGFPDAQRFAADGNYRTGWQDGVALCKKK